jgi:hypothetical protein
MRDPTFTVSDSTEVVLVRFCVPSSAKRPAKVRPS